LRMFCECVFRGGDLPPLGNAGLEAPVPVSISLGVIHTGTGLSVTSLGNSWKKSLQLINMNLSIARACTCTCASRRAYVPKVLQARDRRDSVLTVSIFISTYNIHQCITLDHVVRSVW